MAIHSMQRTLIAGLLFAIALFPQIASAINYAELYEKHSRSVVTINTKTLKSDKDGVSFESGIGSGFLIEPSLVMTAAHVVKKADIIQVTYKDETSVLADVVATVVTGDVALLRLKEVHANPIVATLGDSDKTAVGEPVFVIGAPFGIKQTLSIGFLSGRTNRGKMEDGQPFEFLHTDTAINPGNSGGPMFNQHGDVIGIVSFILSKSGGFEGIGFASASNTAHQALMQSTGYRAGFEGQVLSPKLARALNIPSAGVLVQRVVEGSIVHRAGLKAGRIAAKIQGRDMWLGGDVILEINGMLLEKPEDVSAFNVAARGLADNDEYDIRIFRNGAEMRLKNESLPRSAMLSQQ